MNPFFREIIVYLPPAPSLWCGIPNGLGYESLPEELVEIAVEGPVRDLFIDKFGNILLDRNPVCLFLQTQDSQ